MISKNNKKMILILATTIFVLIVIIVVMNTTPNSIFYVNANTHDSQEEDDDDYKLEPVLGMNISYSNLTDTKNNIVDSESLKILKNAGVTSLGLTLHWNDFEYEPYKYKAENDMLNKINSLLKDNELSISLTFPVIDSKNKNVPEDLMKLSFKNAKMIKRFKGFLNYIIYSLPDVDIISIAIGNEVDTYYDDLEVDGLSFKRFYEKSIDYLHSIDPDFCIGTKIWFYGNITEDECEYIMDINEKSDTIMLAYYPIDDNGMARSPSSVFSDFNVLTNSFPDYYIEFMELGYTSSEKLGSSQEQQAEFIKNVFQAWNDHNDHISLINYSWLNEISEKNLLKYAKEFNITDSTYIEFIGSKALRGRGKTAQEKQALKVLRDEVKAIDWLDS